MKNVNKHTRVKEILCIFVTTVEKVFIDAVYKLKYQTKNDFGIVKNVYKK